jgi:hypothetical protein
MRTSYGVFALAALLAVVAGTASAQEVSWRKTYQEARDQGQKAKKPLAVFIGTGPNGHDQLIQDGTLTPDIRKILVTEYVPIYLDADKADDQRLIQALGITTRRGLVLSDRVGESQAFFHDGRLTEREILRQLTYFSAPDVIVNSTMTNSRYSYYPSSGTYPSDSTSSRPATSANC